MDLLDGIRQRRSVRVYKPDPVSVAMLEELAHAAVQAPSAMDEEPWRFTVVTNQERLDNISDKAKSFMLTEVRGTANESRFHGMLSSKQFQIFYHAPALVVISAAATLPWAVEDCALAAENFMLAACARGLGTCWIGFAQAWLNTPEGRAQLDLESGQRVVAPIIVGHPQGAPPTVARRPPDIRWIT